MGTIVSSVATAFWEGLVQEYLPFPEEDDKGSLPIVMLDVVVANYFFRVIDVGAFGKASDGGTLSYSAFGQVL